MTRPPRRSSWQWTTLLVSLGLAATLGATLYFTASSLPYLATSPSTDPTFGALNACLHGAVPSRTGFAVGRDARRALAWSTSQVAHCTLDTDTTRLETWPIAGVTEGAFDGEGGAWVVSQASGLSSSLLRLDGETPTVKGETAAMALAGAAEGVVVLEPSGRLVAISSEGTVTGATQVPVSRTLELSTSADGRRVAVTGDGAVRVYDARTLSPLRLEAPCDVDGFWWLRAGHQALVTCRPDGLGLVLDVETGAQEAAAPAKRVASVLAGPTGPWVEPCDVLPCTSPPPVDAR